MSWLSWLKGKPRTSGVTPTKVAPPASKKPEPQKKEQSDPQQKLWQAESSDAMRSLISNSTDQDLTTLVGALAFMDFPLNSLASAAGSLDKRSTLTTHFAFQLLKAEKHSQANQLLTKILDKMRAKLSVGKQEGGVVPSGKEQVFESAFAAGDMGSATEILKQHRSTHFWRIDEVLKRELYDLSMELLRRDRSKDAAILLDAVMLDYPQDLESEFWRVSAYHNICVDSKSDSQAKEKARQAINSFLQKADGNPQYMSQCSALRKIMNTEYIESQAGKEHATEPPVQRKEATPSADKPSTPSPQTPQPKSEEQQPAKIGNVKILLALNQKTVDLLQSKGVEWPEAICFFMAKNFGSRGELEISSDRATLSTVSKVRCQTTPMYRDKGGVIYVLFEELDNEAKQKEGLEFLGTIDPERYAGALCAQFGVTGKNIYV